MEKLLKKFNIRPKNRALFVESLTHSSYINEHDNYKENLEKLEFMGDAVLQLLVSDLIYKYGNPEDEGIMSLMRSNLVRAESLAVFAKKIDLGSYLLLGSGEEKTGGRNRLNILADAFEAFIGAIFIDQGYEKAKVVVKKIFLGPLKNLKLDELIDYKTKLQEVVQSDSRKTIKYVELSRKGASNRPYYKFAVILDGKLELARGEGKSKKEAQQDAAKKALDKCAVN